METTSIVSIIVGVVGTVTAIGGVIIEHIRKVKLEKKLSKLEDYTSLNGVIFDAVQVAELKYKSFEKGGMDCATMKKEDVIQTARTAAIQNGWDYDEKQVDEYIETLIAFSKAVNKVSKNLNGKLSN